MPAQPPIGSEDRPLRVAIVGSGPAGFFTADALLKRPDLHLRIDLFNRTPTPYGLVRDGVAPDHQEIKAVTRSFDKVAARPEVRFFGNVTLGTDLQVEDLRRHYDQIVYAVGAPSDRKLGIPGEELAGSLPATAFVGWYNGNPDHRDLQPFLDHPRVVVVGNGNVAVDVTRILVRDVDELARTDLADHALEALRRSRVREVVVLGRRGPAQAAFTTPELRELGQLEGVDVVVDPRQLDLDPESLRSLEGNRVAGRNLERLREFSQRELRPGNRRIVLRFLSSPVEILPAGADEGRVGAVRIEENELHLREDGSLRPRGTGRSELLECGMVLRSVGYRCVPIPGIPFDEARSTLANVGGRIVQGPGGPTVPGEYVVGWAKRGPSGVIGTNKADANDTVARMLEDLSSPDGFVPAGGATPRWEPESVDRLLEERVERWVSWSDWERLRAHEERRGSESERPRVKCCRVPEMLEVIR